MTPELQAVINPVVGGIVAILLAGNLWFIRQLVVSIKENTDKTAKLEVQMAGVMGKLEAVAQVARDYPKLETKVEVLAERVKAFRLSPDTFRR